MKNKNLGLYIVIGVLVILVIGLIIFMQSNSTKSVNYVDGNQSTQNLSANLDCSNCPAKIETKVETKTITESIYVCSNGEEVVSKESCVDYINPNWDLSSNKSELIEILNQIENPLNMGVAVEVTKLTISDNILSISFTNKGGAYQAEDVGQTMFSVLKETANYLKLNKKLDYDIDISATTSNGGYVFYKKTTKQEVLDVLNYDIGMDDWINKIKTK